MRSSSSTECKAPSRMKYIYCLINTKKEASLGPIGIDEAPVYTVNYKEVAALVSDTRDTNFEVLDHGITHQKVVERAMAEYGIIPMAFGQTSTDTEIKAFLSQRYQELRKMFAHLDGKEELGLKVIWKKDAILRDIATSSDRIRILTKHLNDKPGESPYGLKMELGKLVMEELKARGKKISGEMIGELSKTAVEYKLNETLGDDMIVNAAFMVEKSREKEFDERLDRLEAKYKDWVTMKYVVAPPYNFATMRTVR